MEGKFTKQDVTSVRTKETASYSLTSVLVLFDRRPCNYKCSISTKVLTRINHVNMWKCYTGKNRERVIVTELLFFFRNVIFLEI